MYSAHAHKLRCFSVLFLLLLLTGCAAVKPHYDPPVVGISSFRLLPSQSVSPRFEIGLRLLNPNPEPLQLAGLAYTVAFEDHKILMGVAHNLPTIEPYGEGNIILEATADLLSGARLLGSLLNTPRSSVSYTFSAKLDIGRFGPPIRVIEEKCTGCGTCAEYCPVQYPDPFNQDISENKAVHIYFSQAVPLVPYIDENCLFLKDEKCSICVGVCQNQAIDLHQVHSPLSFSSAKAEMNAMADLLEPERCPVGRRAFHAQHHAPDLRPEPLQCRHEFLFHRGAKLVAAGTCLQGGAENAAAVLLERILSP